MKLQCDIESYSIVFFSLGLHKAVGGGESPAAQYTPMKSPLAPIP